MMITNLHSQLWLALTAPLSVRSRPVEVHRTQPGAFRETH